MNFFRLLKTEFKKNRRSKIIPLIFIAPLLVVTSGVANLQNYLTPEYTNAWAAMFIQSALIYSYYLLPLSMVVVCVMIMGCETKHNGILKMLVLPVSRYTISASKFCVLLFYLLIEIVVFLVVFIVAGLYATHSIGITETLPFTYLLKWCAALYLTMLPSLSVMWTMTILFDKPILSIGANIFLILPSILVANTPLWIVYPYCYPGYLVSCSLHAFTTTGIDTTFNLFPFAPCSIAIFSCAFLIAILFFGQKERK